MRGRSGTERGDDPRIQPGTPPFVKAPRGDDPEQNARTIYASNPEHLLVFKAPRGDDLEHNAGTIQTSNLGNTSLGGGGGVEPLRGIELIM